MSGQRAEKSPLRESSVSDSYRTIEKLSDKLVIFIVYSEKNKSEIKILRLKL